MALVLALVAVTTYAAFALFSRNSGMFVVGLALAGAAAASLWVQQPRDFAALCVAVLGLDALLIAAWGRLLSSGNLDLGGLLLFGIGAASIVAGSVTVLLQLHRGASGCHISQRDAA